MYTVPSVIASSRKRYAPSAKAAALPMAQMVSFVFQNTPVARPARISLLNHVRVSS